MKQLIVIPAYNTNQYIFTLIEKIRLSTDTDILIYDDGSNPSISLKNSFENIILKRNAVNRGKGNVLIKAFNYALKNNFTHIVTIDSDLDVTGNLSVIPSASAGTDVKAELSTYSSDIDVGGELTVQGTWAGGGLAYTPKGIFEGGTGAHEYGKMTMLAGADVTLSSGVTEIQSAGSCFRLDIQTGYNTTYSNGGGTVKFTSSSDQLLYSTGQQADNWTQFNNLILEKTSSTLQGMTTVGFHIKVENDLLITSGILKTKTTNNTEHDLTAGSLTIADGGTYSATSGTTTIDGGGDCLDFTAGTLTHNNGLFKISGGNGTGIKTTGATANDNLYDLEIDSSESANATTSWLGDGTVIEGNLTLTEGKFTANTSSHDFTVRGNTLIKADATFGNMGGTQPTGDYTFGGLVTNSGGIFLSTGDNNYNGGIRQLASVGTSNGTFNGDAETITIGGTGGILEGNLDDAIINVNLDAVLELDGAGDYIDCGTGMCTALGDNYAGNITLSLWLRANETNSNDGVIAIGTTLSDDDGIIVVKLEGNNLKFGLNQGGWKRTIPFTQTNANRSFYRFA